MTAPTKSLDLTAWPLEVLCESCKSPAVIPANALELRCMACNHVFRGTEADREQVRREMARWREQVEREWAQRKGASHG